MNDKTLDCSDIDQYLGKPIQPARMVEPIHNNDIRRWAQGMHYPNRLHYDGLYAAEGRWGRLVAPQSFAVTMDDGHGSAPSCVGGIPNSHLLFGGDEWWFHGPRMFGGDVIRNERIPFDYVVKETKFAGPTCFQRGDNYYYNAQGDLIAKQRSTSIRYRADLARDMGVKGDAEDPVWTDEQIAELEKRKFSWIQMLHDLGHGRRYWDDVKVGDKLPERVFGPHTIVSFATEWRAYLFTIWGGTHRRTDLDLAALGFVDEMAGHENDPVMERINPELTDGAYFGPSRGHLFPRWARFIGMPRAYGYGASMGAWILDYLAGWAGEWGLVVHSAANYRGPAFSGDITIMNANVIDKRVDDQGRSIVQVDYKMTNQLGTTLATAKAEIQLPTK
jgi:N-terminal half of MaoC dehydratase